MRRTRPLAAALLLAVGACGPAELVVTMELDGAGETGQAMALGDMEVQLLPYDRDQVFDSLEAAFGDPEPTPPEDLITAREAVQDAQEEWRQSEARWNTLRDTLQTITEAMEQYNRGEARYRLLFREFQDLESELGRVERQMNQAFDQFQNLQSATIQRSDSMRIQIDNWADEAFAGAFDVFTAKTRASGLAAVVDTTGADGMIRLQAPPGNYWVHARYELPYSELYWNVPVTLERGEPQQIRLSAENAQERIKF